MRSLSAARGRSLPTIGGRPAASRSGVARLHTASSSSHVEQDERLRSYRRMSGAPLAGRR